MPDFETLEPVGIEPADTTEVQETSLAEVIPEPQVFRYQRENGLIVETTNLADCPVLSKIEDPAKRARLARMAIKGQAHLNLTQQKQDEVPKTNHKKETASDILGKPLVKQEKPQQNSVVRVEVPTPQASNRRAEQARKSISESLSIEVTEASIRVVDVPETNVIAPKDTELPVSIQQALADPVKVPQPLLEAPTINELPATFTPRRQPVAPAQIVRPESAGLPPMAVVAAKAPRLPVPVEAPIAIIASVPGDRAYREQLTAPAELPVADGAVLPGILPHDIRFADMLDRQKISDAPTSAPESEFEIAANTLETTGDTQPPTQAERAAVIIQDEIARVAEAEVLEILDILSAEIETVTEQAPEPSDLADYLPVEQEESVLPMPLATVEEQVRTEVPLAEVFAGLAQYVSSELSKLDYDDVEPVEAEAAVTSAETDKREVITRLIEDIYLAAYPDIDPDSEQAPDGQLDDPDQSYEAVRKPEITKQLAVKLLVLLQTLGYEHPQEVLREFMRYHDLEFLLRAIRHMHQLQNPAERKEVLMPGLTTMLRRADDVRLSLTARIGRALTLSAVYT